MFIERLCGDALMGYTFLSVLVNLPDFDHLNGDRDIEETPHVWTHLFPLALDSS